MGFLKGKKALIVGMASSRSIAYGVAQAFHKQGAELAFACQNEKLVARVTDLAKDFNSSLIFPCDVAQDNEIERLAKDLNKHWDKVDIIVHAVAFAPADQISGDFVTNANRLGFQIAHDISSYSFIALAKAFLPMMEDTHGSLLTLSYYGAEKVVPNYNIMGLAKASLEASVRYMAQSLGAKGIRVNAISAGPIKTLAAAGIKDFRKMLQSYAQSTPLQRNISIEEVGNSAAFLCSDLASAITGEILHVDAGFHAVALQTESLS
ncbi:MAG: enoyl-ACP reductase [Gammaproteobacteria bacterium]|nr:enoyl-ACP reductase [Gammaproteobacteria bacterium]